MYVTMKPLHYLALPLFLLHLQDVCATRQTDTLEARRKLASENNVTQKTTSRCLSACDNPRNNIVGCIVKCQNQLLSPKPNFLKQQTNSKKILVKRQTPSIELLCYPSWNGTTHQYSVNITWTLLFPHLSWVVSFQIDHRKYRSGVSYFYHKTVKVYPVVNKFTYAITDDELTPLKKYEASPLQMDIKVRMHLSQQYPNYHQTDQISKLCRVDMSPPSPSSVVNLTATVENIIWESLGAVIHGISLQWLPPSTPNTHPVTTLKYQIDIGDINSTHEQPKEIETVSNQDYMTIANISSFTIFTSGSPHEIFLWVRSYYTTTVETFATTNNLETDNSFSNWSDPVLLKALLVQPSVTSATIVAVSNSTLIVKSIQQSSNTDIRTLKATITTSLVQPSTGILVPNGKSLQLIIGILSCAVILITCVIVIIVLACIIHIRRKLHLKTVFRNDSQEDWLPVFQRSEFSLDASLSLNGPCADKWELPAHAVIINEKLGEGEFGEVFKGEILQSDATTGIPSTQQQQPAAVKLLKAHASAREKSDFLKEIELMKKIAQGNNPHVVNMLGCVTLQEPLVLITEFVEYGDLHSYLTTCRKQMQMQQKMMENDKGVKKSNSMELTDCENITVTPWDMISFAYQIASGMEYLTSLNVVHRDLACRNILIGENKSLKITDFGMSRMLANDNAYVKTTTARLPLKWMAIESIIHREFTSASDVWAFGVTLWEIYTLGGFPYSTVDNNDLLMLLKRGYRLEKPDNCPSEVYDIMLVCWEEHPEDRPSFVEIRGRIDSMLSSQKTTPLYVQLFEEKHCGINEECGIDEDDRQVEMKSPTSPTCTDTHKLSTALKSASRVSLTGDNAVTETCTGASYNPYVSSPTRCVTHEQLLRPRSLSLSGLQPKVANTSTSTLTPNMASVRLSDLLTMQSPNGQLSDSPQN